MTAAPQREPDPRRIDLLLQRCRLEVDSGALPSAQVALNVGGVQYAAETFGAADPSTRYVLQSAGRPVVAGVLWKLMSDGLLDIGRTVASYIPEFGTRGKDVVTVEQVVTHVGGFPLAPLGYPHMLDRAERLRAFSKWRLTYQPGTRLQFHLTSAAWVIAELCERLTGRPIATYLRETLTGPLGLDSIEIGPPVERQHDVASFVRTDDDDCEVNPWGPWYLARPEILAAGEPSHSMVATAADLAAWYQALMTSPLWRREVIEDALRVRVTLPVTGERGGTPSVPGNVALFVVVAGDDGTSRAFLPTATGPQTFGHGGAPCQIGFADPETGLSFAFLTNGYPTTGYERSRRGLNRIINIANLAADCFG
ncbi:serine hydrolase domain-containing protein [Mycobacterium branderi]|uniref:Serine hydrolase n=1 Tax=Mycobacterium branderi TaxID=43348 RepID=A0A7I7WEA2_9MYCO|nr:serine hydrolase domain-containing protein [Mycobacterium branderi]MCV7231575.1 beta-lactamase family protein [Mycobacterium branderi]ORA40427.1 serine hydrolase [Mycobacterium branderi]BBZ14941.1 serine hydrolase [Mycobacterium branderi]